MPAPAAWTLGRWRTHPTARFAALVLTLVGLYQGYLYATGPLRMTERLRARLAEQPAIVDVLVTAKFPPEEFHIRLYQQVGTMRGVEGHTARLHRVQPASVRYLSRHYWIRTIDLAPDEPRR
jgi:hypothetical protein